MSLKAFPLNQQEYSYNAQDVMKYYAGRNSGVFETGENLKVSANGGLEIRVNSGMGWLARDYVVSVAFWNESVEYLMVDAGNDTYDRIDLVVVSWNFVQQEQNPKLIIRKGTPASSPAVPLLVNNSSTIEIALARINVGKGSIELHDADIVDLRGDDTYCPMVYDEQTIREAFRKCVGYADGANKISDFPSATPASSDKILIEQGGEGKSASLESLPIPTSVQNKLDTKVNYSDSLTYEEIMATNANLTNKVANAGSLNTVATRIGGIVVKNIEVQGTKTIKLKSIGGEIFTGILLARTTKSSYYSMYFLSGYAHGLSRYDSVLINAGTNPIASIDNKSVANTISITVNDTAPTCLTFLWFYGGDTFEYEII